jgi:hypothetical protein
MPFSAVEELRNSLKDCQIKQGEASEVWSPLPAGPAWYARVDDKPR